MNSYDCLTIINQTHNLKKKNGNNYFTVKIYSDKQIIKKMKEKKTGMIP